MNQRQLSPTAAASINILEDLKNQPQSKSRIKLHLFDMSKEEPKQLRSKPNGRDNP